RAPLQVEAAPGWFASQLGPAPLAISVAVPKPVAGYSSIRLEPTADLDVVALWREFSVGGLALAGSAVAALLPVYVAIGAALRPLDDVSRAFLKIGEGDYSGRLDARVPSELVPLERGFNEMADRLAAMDARNRTLESQLLTLQEEERADLARDL